MILYNLFLDDFRVPSDAFKYMKDSRYTMLPWTIVKNYDEFVDLIERSFHEGKFPELVSFDHDLQDDHYENDGKEKEKTGMHCAKWLVNFCMDKKIDLPKYLVHSMNPAGKVNIEDYLQSYLKVQHQL